MTMQTYDSMRCSFYPALVLACLATVNCSRQPNVAELSRQVDRNQCSVATPPLLEYFADARSRDPLSAEARQFESLLKRCRAQQMEPGALTDKQRLGLGMLLQRVASDDALFARAERLLRSVHDHRAQEEIVKVLGAWGGQMLDDRRYEDASRKLDECASQASRFWPNGDVRESICEVNRASLEYSSGLARQAVERLTASIPKLRTSGTLYHSRYLFAEGLLGQIFIERDMGVSEGVKILAERKNLSLKDRIVLASGLIKLGRFNDARDHLRQALPAARDARELSRVHGVLGWLEQEAGNHEQSRSYLAQALLEAERAYPENHPDRSDVLLNHYFKEAVLFESMRRDTDMQHDLAECERRIKPGGRDDQDFSWRMDFLRGMSAMAQGQKERALEAFKSAERRQEDWLRVVLTIGSEEERRDHLTNQYETRLADILYSLPAIFGNDEATVRAAYAFVLARKGRAWDSMSWDFRELRERSDPSTRALFSELSQSAKRLDDKRLPAGEAAAEAKRYDELTARLGRLNPAFRSPRVSLADVEDAAAQNQSVLVDYVRYRPYKPKEIGLQKRFPAGRGGAEYNYAVFVVEKGHAIDWIPLESESGLIDKAVTRLLVSFEGKNDDLSVAASRQLYAMLFPERLRKRLAGKTEWIISGDGPLQLIPFGALSDAPGHYIVEDVTLRYANSAREVGSWSGGKEGASQRSCVFFNPQIPHAEDEARTVASALGIAATPATIGRIRDLHSPRVLHFAGRARAEGVDNAAAAMTASRLTLSTAEGQLSARQFALIDLGGTRLCTLSACDTGLGLAVRGDGVYGLRRAVSLAGAHSAILSLWQVESESTADLMKEFYQRVNGSAGEEFGRALHAVQASKASHGVPLRLWAGMVFSGPKTRLAIGDRSAAPLAKAALLAVDGRTKN